jgi:hypothetical protein
MNFLMPSNIEQIMRTIEKQRLQASFHLLMSFPNSGKKDEFQWFIEELFRSEVLQHHETRNILMYPGVSRKWNLRIESGSFYRHRGRPRPITSHFRASMRASRPRFHRTPKLWDALSAKPLFAGSPRHDYARHRAVLEHIFSEIFPSWNRDSLRTNIFPRAHIPPSVIYNWRSHEQADPNCRPWQTEVHRMNFHRRRREGYF